MHSCNLQMHKCTTVKFITAPLLNCTQSKLDNWNNSTKFKLQSCPTVKLHYCAMWPIYNCTEEEKKLFYWSTVHQQNCTTKWLYAWKTANLQNCIKALLHKYTTENWTKYWIKKSCKTLHSKNYKNIWYHLYIYQRVLQLIRQNKLLTDPV